MKGYECNGYYYGYVSEVRKYWQFESEAAYREFMRERGEI